MVALRTLGGLVDDLEGLASALDALDLRAAVLSGSHPGPTRDRLVRTIRSYLVPRLTNPETHLSVVFAGPTGSGKSTLVNSLCGLDISPTGPIRPTTEGPVILVAESAADQFDVVGGVGCEVVTGEAPILTRMALVDTPDIDSTSTEHRATAEMLIDHADVVVFVTSALRYADLVPWEILRRATSRGTQIIHVLNRVTAGAAGALVDFKARLARVGVEGDVIRVPEHHLQPRAQGLPAMAVRELGRRLVVLAKDRDRYRKEVLDRVIEATVQQCGELAHAVDADRLWVEDVEERTRRRFSGRAFRLDLGSLTGDFTMGGGPGSGPRRVRRWLRANRLTESALEAYEMALGSQITAKVDTDVRLAILDIATPILEISGATIAHVADGLGQMTLATVDGWFKYVRRITELSNSDHERLTAAVMVWRSLGSAGHEATRHLLGEEEEILVARAARELVSRLQVIYAHAGERVVDLLHTSAGEPSGEDLRRRVSSMAARSDYADGA